MTEPKQPSGLTYADSGVDLKRAQAAKQHIRRLAQGTFNASVLSEIGAFGGLYRPPWGHFQDPLLVSSVDGVGTKLKIAFLTGVHDTVGVDIVAHCANDILVQGALPLFFMDYIAMGELKPGVVEELVAGLARGCRQSQCALLGGETAEMPDFYAAGEYDLAGFIVGLVDGHRLLTGRQIDTGHTLIGLPSTGLHTNGYSLVRKLFFERLELSVEDYVPALGRTVGEELLIPHRNYFSLLKELVLTDELSGLAHITGGGIAGNLNRILPSSKDAVIQRGSWEILPIFRYIREQGQVSDAEMYRTFNMGLGMILVTPPDKSNRVQSYLQARNESYFLIGEIAPGQGEVRLQ